MFSFLFLLLFSCTKNNNDSQVVSNDNSIPETKANDVNTQLDGNSFYVVSKTGESRKVDVKSPQGTTDGLSYIIGYNATSQLGSIIERIYARTELSDEEIGSLLQGIIDKIAGKDMDWEYMNEVGMKLNEDSNKRLEEIRALAKAYYEGLKSNENMKTTSSGLIYEIIEANENGKAVLENESVNVDYKMQVFVSEGNFKTIDEGNGVDFPLTSLIQGATEGIKLMKEGEKFVFYIVPELGYGNVQVSADLEANSYLKFEVKLNKVNEAKDDSNNQTDETANK